jgi:hypothetical protein
MTRITQGTVLARDKKLKTDSQVVRGYNGALKQTRCLREYIMGEHQLFH